MKKYVSLFTINEKKTIKKNMRIQDILTLDGSSAVNER